MKFPVTLAAEYRGKARIAGSFVSGDGEKISYGESYSFEFEDADGVVDSVPISAERCDQVAGFDVGALPKGTMLTIVGNVGSGERGIYLAPVSITKPSGPTKVAAA